MTRQLVLFFAVGLMQYGVDALLFTVLFSVGLPVGLANIIGRALAAVAGFRVNAVLTFRDQRGANGWGSAHALRFALLWMGMTVASTSLMLLSAHLVSARGLSETWIVGAKLGIEGVLAALSFALSKWWVFTQ